MGSNTYKTVCLTYPIKSVAIVVRPCATGGLIALRAHHCPVTGLPMGMRYNVWVFSWFESMVNRLQVYKMLTETNIAIF